MTEETEGRYLKCDPQTLAVIAAQYIACGVDEDEALRKANALYLKATAYAKKFASLSPDEQAIEVEDETALRELGEREGQDLPIGDSEANSPAFEYFHATAKAKLDKNITYKKFLEIIERFHDRRPEDQKTGPWTPPGGKIGRGIVDDLFKELRQARSQARSGRRKKSVKKSRRAG